MSRSTSQASPRNTSSRYTTGAGNTVDTNPSSVSAAKAPLLYADKWITHSAGGVALLFGWTLLPLFIVLAYCAELAEADITNRRTTVKFLHFRHTILDGIRGLGVCLLLFIPTITAWTLFGGLYMVFESTNGFILFSNMFFIVSLFATLATTALALYALPAVFVESVRVNSATGALNKHMVSALLTPQYFLTWWLSIVIVIGGFTVWGMMTMIPFVGIIFGPPLAFYCICVAVILTSRAVDQAPDEMPRPLGGRTDSQQASAQTWAHWRQSSDTTSGRDPTSQTQHPSLKELQHGSRASDDD